MSSFDLKSEASTMIPFDELDEDYMLDMPVELPECQNPTATPTPNEYGPLITVFVGTGYEQENFSIHSGLLTHYSSLFRTLINPPSKESEASSTSAVTTIYLPSDDPEVFRDFHHWLYLHELYPHLEPCNAIPLTSEDIIRNFVFGEVHGIPDLCNAAINLLFQKLTQARAVPLRKELEFAYKHTEKGSPLRKFLAEDAASAWPWGIIASNGKEYPEQFLRDVLAAAYKGRISPGHLNMEHMVWVEWRKGELCKRYHIHP